MSAAAVVSPVRMSATGRLAIVAACSGAYLAFLDTTIVNIAFPAIRVAFPSASLSELSWILDAYLIVIAALLVPAGALADRLGRRDVFVAAIALFAVTSAACAIAWSWPVLVAARALQGIAAAAIAPVSLAILMNRFPTERRNEAVALWGAAAAAAAASGPVLGGLLVALDSWRLVFWINLPLGLLAIAAVFRALPRDLPRAGATLPDLVGSFLVAVGLGVAALAIVEGDTWGRLSTAALACYAVTLLALGAVVPRLTRHARPVVEPALLRVHGFAVGNAGSLLFGMAFFSLILGNVLFLTELWGYSVLRAGLAVAPSAIVGALVAKPASVLVTRHGFRPAIALGVLVYLAAIAQLATMPAEPDYVGHWLPAMICTGIGGGLSFPTLGAAALAFVSESDFAAASAVNAACRQFGGVLGIAVLIAVIGEPTSASQALDHAHAAFMVAGVAALASGAVALLFLPRRSGA